MEPIAIISSAYRFPSGATTEAKLWELLHNPRDIASEPDVSRRLNLRKIYHADGDRHGCTPVTESYFLDEDTWDFDAAFFGISPLEAEAMDPQQRLLLETVYEASEAAGYGLERLKGRDVPVYCGAMTCDYSDIQLRDPEDLSMYTSSGTGRSILANRISYFFDLKGPSVTIDTACSSSLVAVHLAVQSLRAGEGELAIVTGCNLILSPEPYIAESKLHMLSPSGRSRMWDADADGYARGEGIAAVFLKPLSRAIRDNDHIEGIIRNTGANSDGRTPGITMPDSTSQASLIERTYRAIGLDPRKAEDRCQYFEAHGTGTPTGDPIEARAISGVFFPESANKSIDERLLVGSVKTVVGHLEGCAGLAGLIKVLLAMKHGVVPPNLHFNRLNPRITPFYDNLEVPTEALPWPSPPPGQPRRASVNSFGFGGTNAHAIIESYEQLSEETPKGFTTEGGFPGPFTFSAASKKSLASNIFAMAKYLRTHPRTNLSDLAWTLMQRRSQLGLRRSFAADSQEKLIRLLEEAVKGGDGGVDATVPSSERAAVGILGVFTGQGAQWPEMGRELLKLSPVFSATVDRCEKALASLPDAPTWSLKEELLASKEKSRIGEAEIAQPATTAVQIGLVDMLSHCGIRFGAVVGHSSGEIAAVYAAEIISAEDAIRIAFYRGAHAHLAGNGAMLAVGMSFAEAEAFCRQPQYQHRIGIAAKNAPASVTLSGDSDAIFEAKSTLNEAQKFNRLLHVDRAYHSTHMRRCADEYLKSLRACGIKPRPGQGCLWVSSVRGNARLQQENLLETLEGPYWIDNLVSPVLMADAVAGAWTAASAVSVAIEVGPHPSLKGPVAQTLKEITPAIPPYRGLMTRESDCAVSFAEAVGFLWSHLGSSTLDHDGYRRCWLGGGEPRLLTGLPSYHWDNRPYWRESRISRNHRLRHGKACTLLGRRCQDDSNHEPRWRNVLSLKELPWLCGHSFQGQALFPAAGYVSMVMEGAVEIAGSRPLQLIEITDMIIERPVVLDDSARGVETICSFKIAPGRGSKHRTEASFACYFCHDAESGDVQQTCNGTLEIVFDDGSDEDSLPPRARRPALTSPVDVESFYASLRGIGLQYDYQFKALRTIERKDGSATTTASWGTNELDSVPWPHPAMLDVSLQSAFASFCSPSTDSLWTAYLPTSIQRVTVEMGTDPMTSTGGAQLSVDAYLTNACAAKLVADINIFGLEDRPLAQFEGVTMTSLAEADASTDRLLFSKTTWEAELLSNPETVQYSEKQSAADAMLVKAAERMSLFFYRKMLEEAEGINTDTLKWHHKRMLEAARVLVDSARSGTRPVVEKAWLSDTREVIDDILREHPDQIDFKLLCAAGDSMSAVFRNEKQIHEILFQDDMMYRFYRDGLGLGRMNAQIAGYARQITHRYPKAKILELGAGTAATTDAVLESIGDGFSSYTFSDVSSSFFVRPRQKFARYGDRVIFQTLDIGRPVGEQGFEEYYYDIIIAANVLHVTENVQAMLQRVRRLLKPGGYLLAVEPTSDLMRTQLIMGGFDGWWLGADDGRVLSPVVVPTAWDEKLRESGFSGVDVLHHDADEMRLHYCSSFVSQAVTDSFNTLREPIEELHMVPEGTQFLLIGGSSLQTSKVVRALCGMLSSFGHRVSRLKTVREAALISVPPLTCVLCLEEVDAPLFRDGVCEQVLEGMRNIFEHSLNVLWLTREGSAWSRATVGFARGLRAELPSLRLQTLELDPPALSDSRAIAEHFLRLVHAQTHSLDAPEVVWTVEPEISVKDGKLLIPRVKLDHGPNERLNASRRRILRDTSPADEIIQLSTSPAPALFARQRCLQPTAPDAIDISVCASTLFALKITQSTALHLCLGATTGSKPTPCLAFSPQNCSVIHPPSAHTVVLSDSVPLTVDSLALLTTILAANRWVRSTPTGATIWLHGLTDHAADIFENEAARRGIDVFRTTSQPDADSQKAEFIHPREPVRALKQRLSSRIASVVVAGDDGPRFLARICPFFASKKATLGTVDLFPPLAESPSVDSALAALLADALESWNQLSLRPLTELSATSVSLHELSLSASDQRRDSFCIVDWRSPGKVQVTLEPITASTSFAPDKTYLLVGMTGSLGISLCTWMGENGARHLVLTSRKPNVEQEWLDLMSNKGAEVLLLPMDVADRASVEEAYSKICEQMPPVAGVANGAMVLSDAEFANMDAKGMEAALQPKVNGSVNLDAVFYDRQLDFFIMFSSLGSIIGVPGQTNYHTANLFMAGLAAERRRRGLAASVVHLGMVVDVGYLTRQDKSMERGLRRMYMHPLSARDVHAIFAEASAVGRPDSAGQPELITGLRISEDESERPFWAFSNPTLSFFVRDAQVIPHDPGDEHAAAELGKILKHEEDEAVALVAVVEAFARKLEALLQLQSGSFSIETSLISLGVDSLLAIELRTWLLKELGADIPFLQIINGACAKTICRAALDQFRLRNGPGNAPTQAPQPNNVGNQDTSTSSDKEDHFSTTSGVTTPSSEEIPEETMNKIWAPRTRPQPRIQRTERMGAAQEKLWFLHNYLEDKTSYNETLRYTITGPLDINKFMTAIHRVLSRHEGLRTRFFTDPATGLPMQAVMDSPLTIIRCLDGADDAAIQEEFAAMNGRDWDLENGVALGVTLLRHARDRHTFIIGGHHIVFDGVSGALILQDIDRAYRKRPLPDVSSYVDYTIQQNRSLADGSLNEELQFWKQELAQQLPTLPLLPMSRATSRVTTNRIQTATEATELDAHLVSKIKAASSLLGLTPFHFHLSVLQLLISKLANVAELCIGIVDAGRSNTTFANTVGYFVNIIPVKLHVSEGDTFAELVKRAAAKVFTVLAKAAVPMDALLDELKVSRTATHTPLCQIVINYRLGVHHQASIGECKIRSKEWKGTSTPHDLALSITELPSGKCSLSLVSREYLYPQEVTWLLLDMYVRLLRSLSDDPRQQTTECAVYDTTSTKGIVHIGQGGRGTCSWPETISRRVQQIATYHANDIAIKEDGGKVHTYEALMDRANSVAAAILDAGVEKSRPLESPTLYVLLLLQPSADFIASLIGTLKTPAVAVPLDHKTSVGRLRAIAEDCRPAVVICHGPTVGTVQALNLPEQVVIIDVSTVSTSPSQNINLSTPGRPALAYYTSGTTGRPKGVVLTQGSYRHNISASTQAFGLSREVVMQQSSLGFDMSALQIFLALANGGSLVIIPADKRGDPFAISSMMVEHGVTATFGTPTEWGMLFQHCPDTVRRCTTLRKVAIGGEAFSLPLISHFRRLNVPQLDLFNMYGPTECSMISNIGLVDYRSLDIEALSQRVSVGPAIDDYSIYILDEHLKPVPIGFPGEVCIGGAGIGLGYLHRPELSSASFVHNPYAADPDVSAGWNKMYRTGDKGIMRPDGSLIILGRMTTDAQVKIRGLRIELDDIASNILKAAQGKLSQAVVSVRGYSQIIVGYVVVAPGIELDDLAGFFEQLIDELPVPSYMRPAMLIQLPQLPMNAQGKVDSALLNELPLPQKARAEPAGQPAEHQQLSTVEAELLSIWQRVLPQDIVQATTIRPDSDFFHLGGNSMSLVNVQKAIQERWQEPVPLIELFQTNTLKKMAARIEADCLGPQAQNRAFWEREAKFEKLEESAIDGPAPKQPWTRHEGITVVMTGATTMLGSRICQCLVDSTSVSRVLCVAVPAADLVKLPTSPKISALVGTLQDPSLGLSAEQQRLIRTNADIILHAGADGSCLNTYASISPQNVNSTKLLAELALHRTIPFHYVSSARVILLSGETSYGERSVSKHYPPADMSEQEGFTATKWVCEKYLENCASATGLPVVVHRHGYLLAPDAPDTDAMNAVVRFSAQMAAVPKLAGVSGFLDYCDADEVAEKLADTVIEQAIKAPSSSEAAAAAVTAGGEASGKAVRFSHHTPGRAFPIADFRKYMRERFGADFEVLPTKEWTARAREVGMTEFLAAFINAMDEKGEAVYPRLLKG